MTVMMPTVSGRRGRPFLSRGTVGMLKLLEVTVCALRRFGLACRWISDGRDADVAGDPVSRGDCPGRGGELAGGGAEIEGCVPFAAYGLD